MSRRPRPAPDAPRQEPPHAADRPQSHLELVAPPAPAAGRPPIDDVPSYDRDALEPGVVHLGVGGFHRAHQELYFHELAERGLRGWGIVGVALRSPEAPEALGPQRGLYTLVERDADDEHVRLIGSLLRVLHAPEDPEAVLAELCDPRVRLVTLTVTSAGWCLHQESGEIDVDHADVVADVADPARPTSAPGYLVEALRRRREAGVAPFTVLSCDNVPRNGEAARTAVVGLARHRDEALAAWIDGTVAFPSSMVDRITPATTPEDVRHVDEGLGLHDRAPVVTERFRQWIIEDDFCNDRPPLHRVGAQFVPDVRPHELMKKRLLNGSHIALAPLGYLAGHRTADGAMDDPAFRELITHLMADEMAPLLPPVPGVDLAAYRRQLLGRLANTRVRDDLQRLARRGSSKVPDFLLASILEARAAGTPHALLTLAVAGWVRYLRGVDVDGQPIEIEDARLEELQPLARQGGTDPRPLLACASVFGELTGDEELARGLQAHLEAFERDGLRPTVEAVLAGTAAPQERAA